MRDVDGDVTRVFNFLQNRFNVFGTFFKRRDYEFIIKPLSIGLNISPRLCDIKQIISIETTPIT